MYGIGAKNNYKIQMKLNVLISLGMSEKGRQLLYETPPNVILVPYIHKNTADIRGKEEFDDERAAEVLIEDGGIVGVCQ